MVNRPAWAEVELDAIVHNLKEIRRITEPQTQIMTVVKANAYGHGAVEVSRTVLNNGADYLGVAILAEAIELRKAGINAPILILGYSPPEHFEEIIQNDITQTVYSLEAAESISKTAVEQGKKAKIHIKIDTGMTRLGFLPGEKAQDEIIKISSLEGIFVEGIYTHFAVSDIRDKTFTFNQQDRFLNFCSALASKGLNIPIKHAANSAAIIDLPQTHLDMVRVGISLYGYYPSQEVDKSKISLRPALSLIAQVAHVKEVAANTSVSYGRTYTTSDITKIATIPVGYADGYTRLLSSKSEVLLKGKKAPVVGTICMDQFMVDVGHIPEVRPGDEAVLIGRQGQEQITADHLAQFLGTINYEILCMLSDRIPRVHK